MKKKTVQQKQQKQQKLNPIRTSERNGIQGKEK